MTTFPCGDDCVGDESLVGASQRDVHAELATTQIYAAGLSERRRATVMALDFEIPKPRLVETASNSHTKTGT